METWVSSFRHPDYVNDVLRLEGSSLITSSGQVVGRWHAKVRRIDWDVHIPPSLADRVAGERCKFDEVAKATWKDLTTEEPGAWYASPWLLKTELSEFLNVEPQLADVQGLRILDVGGTCPVAWRFLASGAAELHHVDVSPETQRVAHARAAIHGVADERLYFHTVPAECLPFPNAFFDFIFSRHSVHHLDRQRAFSEFRRVLRPNGRLLMLEPWLSRPLHIVMQVRRGLLGVSRGTDDPLGAKDLSLLRSSFGIVTMGLNGFGAPLLIRVLKGIRVLRPVLLSLHRFETQRGSVPGLSQLLAMHSWIIARPQ